MDLKFGNGVIHLVRTLEGEGRIMQMRTNAFNGELFDTVSTCAKKN